MGNLCGGGKKESTSLEAKKPTAKQGGSQTQKPQMSSKIQVDSKSANAKAKDE